MGGYNENAYGDKPVLPKGAGKVIGVIITVIIGIIVYSSFSGMSKNDVIESITSSFQREMDTDSQFRKYHLKVSGVELVKKTRKEYDGYVIVLLDGKRHNVPITVIVDGRSCLWETKPMAFGFLAEKEMSNILDIYTEGLNKILGK